MQEPLVSFHSTTELRTALWPPIWPAMQWPDRNSDLFQILSDKGLPPLVSIRAMGLILGINPKLITAIARFPERNYRSFKIAKRSGGERSICAPRVFLKTIQHFILRSILETQLLPSYVNGFVPGRGIISNAQIHQGARYLLNVDLKDFFGSVNETMVQRVFTELGYGDRVARTLTGLSTYQGSLPQGAPTSPYLANLAFRDSDRRIANLCARAQLTYSRYADDMTFSGEEKIPRSFLVELQFELQAEGFEINSKKTHFSGPGQARYVTGLVVNEKVHPNRTTRRRLRAMFHRATVDSMRYRDRSKELLGWASFVHAYNPALGRSYLDTARGIEKATKHEPNQIG